MKRELRGRWCAALRSGDYVQGHEELRTVNKNGDVVGHCCLGVLCDIVDPKGWSGSYHPIVNAVEGRCNSLDKGAREALGIPEKVVKGLYLANDGEGTDDDEVPISLPVDEAGMVHAQLFHEIADLIEQHVPAED